MSAAGERGMWVPKIVNDYEQHIRGSRFFNVVARVKPQYIREQAQAELDTIATRLAKEYPQSNRGWTAQAVSLRDHLAGHLRPALGLLAGGVGLLLLVAIANTANLLIARNATRSQEIAVRAAIGAGRFRLLRQFAAETLLLCWLGCAAGLGVAYLTIQLIVSLAPPGIPALSSLDVDGRMLLFAATLSTVIAVVIGMAPAWQKAGTSAAQVLRGIGRGESDSVPHHRLRAALVVGELAIALLLLAGAGLLLRSFAQLLDTNPGFRADRAAVVQVFTRPGKAPQQLAAFVQQVADRMRQLPDVESVGAVSAMPFIESNVAMKTPVAIQDRAESAAGDQPDAFISIATPGYFAAMQIPLLDGRSFDDRDRMDGAPVAVISETFARRHWPSDSPVGQRLKFQLEGRPREAEIIGVVGDVRHDGLDRPARAEIFVPHGQVPFTAMTFVARTKRDPQNSIRALREQVYAVDPTQPVYRAATTAELVSRTLTDRRFMLAVLLAFAVLAIALAAAGVYGVLSVLTLQRTREFGVRLALGAGRLEILGMVVRQGGIIAAVGLAVGLAAALMFGRVMSGFLYRVTPADPLTLAAVGGIVAAVALIACIVPATRAARVDPAVALRSE
jgi:putative ABC transport system permease protein